MASFDENGKYIKTDWKAGDKITATKLNKIEESIEAVNDNDISRHVEADARLDALEAKDVTHDKELTKVKNLIEDAKDAAELGDYEINSRMQFLEQELNEGIEEVHNVASTVDGKIATAQANMAAQVNTAKEEMTAQVNTAKEEMTAQVNQGKTDMEAMVAEVENIINYYDVVTAKSIGAVGDGLIDDTESIKNAISYCTTNNKILHMSGDYLITDTINITCNIIGEPNFYANVGRDRPALKIVKHRLKLELGDIQDYQNKSDYYNNYHGFTNEKYVGLLIEDIHGCNISFNNLRTFDVGVKISSKSSTGSAFNYIKGNTIMNCKKGLLLSTSNGGWINTNRFENVAFSFSDGNSNYTSDENEKYFIYEEFSDSIGCDSNVFNNLRSNVDTCNFFNTKARRSVYFKYKWPTS
jgi:hypothetical protein